MSIYSSSFFSDDELKEELRNVGFEDVPPEILSLIKEDLARYVDKELFSSLSTPSVEPKSQEKAVKVQSPKLSKAGKSTTSPKKRYPRKTKFLSTHLPERRPEEHDQSTQTYSHFSFSNASNVPFCKSSVSQQKFPVVAPAEREKVKFHESSFPQNLHSKSEENLSPAKLAFNYSSSIDSPDSKYSSSCSSSEKTIKRKVLRRRNGEPVITEVIIKIPFELETSYPESDSFDNSKSFSGEDSSPKSLTSSGSSAIENPKLSLKSSSVLSLTSKCSTATRILNSRKKKNDPVARYSYYKKFWDNFKPPGEKSHDKLRWAIRDKMLDYHL